MPENNKMRRVAIGLVFAIVLALAAFFVFNSAAVSAQTTPTQPVPTATLAPTPTPVPPTPTPVTQPSSPGNPPTLLIFIGVFVVLLILAVTVPFVRSRFRG